ncbi:hypothetical protein JCM16303_002488 [Sporobolomyces ruberrimus]
MPPRRDSCSSDRDTDTDTNPGSDSSISRSSNSSLDADLSTDDDEKEYPSPREGTRGCSAGVLAGLALSLVGALVLLAWWMKQRDADGPATQSDSPEATVKTSSEVTSTSSSSSSPTSASIDSIQLQTDKSTSEDNACFPLQSEPLSTSSAPSQFREEWWCKDSELFGFLGFSYPLEVVDCSNPTNSFDKINEDLKRMKEEFGATMVRPYAVSCREVSVWENLVRACAEHGMGLIVQVWWGFDDDTLWKKTQSSLYELFETSAVSTMAPYVVHSASFGSEPIGDGVLGDDFISELIEFRSKASILTYISARRSLV